MIIEKSETNLSLWRLSGFKLSRHSSIPSIHKQILFFFWEDFIWKFPKDVRQFFLVQITKINIFEWGRKCMDIWKREISRAEKSKVQPKTSSLLTQCEKFFTIYILREIKFSISKFRALANYQNSGFWDARFVSINFTEYLSDRKIMNFSHCSTFFSSIAKIPILWEIVNLMLFFVS